MREKTVQTQREILTFTFRNLPTEATLHISTTVFLITRDCEISQVKYSAHK